jgi:hypothetical protein
MDDRWTFVFEVHACREGYRWGEDRESVLDGFVGIIGVVG